MVGECSTVVPLYVVCSGIYVPCCGIVHRCISSLYQTVAFVAAGLLCVELVCNRHKLGYGI